MNDQVREILLFAPELLGESLAAELPTENCPWQLKRSADELSGHPALVIWCLPSDPTMVIVQREILQLQQRWAPAPLLLVLPADFRHDPAELLALNCDGIVQDPDLQSLREAVQTVLSGGRVLRFRAGSPDAPLQDQPLGLAQGLLFSGLRQIGHDLQVMEALLDPPPNDVVLQLLLEGRCRELRAARNLLLWLWGPLQMGLADAVPLRANSETLDLTLSERQPSAVWNAIQQRIEAAIGNGLSNSTGQLLAIEGLNPERRRDLLLTLLKQLHEVLLRLRHDDLASTRDCKALSERWQSLQIEVKQQALRSVAGSYVRIPLGLSLIHI